MVQVGSPILQGKLKAPRRRWAMLCIFKLGGREWDIPTFINEHELRQVSKGNLDEWIEGKADCNERILRARAIKADLAALLAHEFEQAFREAILEHFGRYFEEEAA